MNKKKEDAAKEEKKAQKKSKLRNKVLKEVSVDLWRTDKLKKALWGIKKIDEIRSKTFQFTKDMSVFGEVREDGTPEGYVGVRDIYREERIVCKLFTEHWGWLGSIEEMTARSISSSYTRKHIMPEFIINLSKSNYLIEVEKILGGFLKKEIYSLYIAREDNTIEPLMIKSKIGFGDDWTVYSLQRGRVASLDGHLFDIGGEYTIKIYDPELAKSREFIETMILFLASLRYHNYASDRIKKAIKKAKKGKESIKIQNDEIELYESPRRIKT